MPAPLLPTRHYEKLQAYLHAVVKDMITRGKIRRAHGQSLDDILHTEGHAVLIEIEGDLARLGKEMGLSFLNALHHAALHAVEDVATQGQDFLLNLVFGTQPKGK